MRIGIYGLALVMVIGLPGLALARNSGGSSYHAAEFRSGPSRSASGASHGGGQGAHPITPRKGS